MVASESDCRCRPCILKTRAATALPMNMKEMMASVKPTIRSASRPASSVSSTWVKMNAGTNR